MRMTAIALAAGCLCLAAAVAPARSEAAGDYVPGELIVTFESGVSKAEGASLARELGAEVVDRASGRPRVALVDLPRGLGVGQADRVFESAPGVAAAEPNAVRRIAREPQDPFYLGGLQWNLSNETDADIDAPGAWGIATGDPDVAVAVIDTGMSIDHPDLEANVWADPGEVLNGVSDDADSLVDDLHGYDFVNEDADPEDDHGHGTHVAGTIGAVGDNGVGVTGINWDVGLMPLKAGDEDGHLALFDLLDAMAYAVAHGAKVVNASYTSDPLSFSAAERDAIAAADDVLFVAAAGNDDADNDELPRYPCSYDLPNVICVAATNQVDALSTFSSGGSNYGKTSVDLAAPGSSVLSTLRLTAFDPPILSEDFEAGLASWTPDMGSTWAAATEQPFASGQHLSDSPGGDYPTDSDTAVQLTDPLDLSGEDACRARFDLAYDIAAGDRLWLEASVDAAPGSWSPLAAYSGSQPVPAEQRVRLFGFSQAASVYLRFRLQSDSSGTADGAHVDDLGVECADESSAIYGTKSGTSMATPHVAGVAALLLDRFPSYTPAQLRSALLDNVDRLPSLHCKVASGGRLNAFDALDIGVPASPLPEDCPPAPVIQPPSPPAFDLGAAIRQCKLKFVEVTSKRVAKKRRNCIRKARKRAAA
ncbi:MAG TPA: S8 family serine peptidase [Solirubrobacterales bacterium]|nr:S8 family serine peptidase [Solirubrobacterales bacterium]